MLAIKEMEFEEFTWVRNQVNELRDKMKQVTG